MIEATLHPDIVPEKMLNVNMIGKVSHFKLLVAVELTPNGYFFIFIFCSGLG